MVTNNMWYDTNNHFSLITDMDYTKKYGFDANTVYLGICDHWTRFMDKMGTNKVIIGISGGIDSTTCAALACRIFGKENVYGLSMPCDTQFDMRDVDNVFDHLGIRRLNFNIGDCYNNIINGVENNAVTISKQSIINLAPRIRMSVLYAFAQSLDAVVINTCNRSESDVNWDTLWGDDCGSYAPIQDLTKTEVRKLAENLVVPESLVKKTPIDGLQNKSDEDAFGFTYEQLDTFIRTGIAEDGVKNNIIKRYLSGKYKLEMVRLVGPSFGFPDYLRDDK